MPDSEDLFGPLSITLCSPSPGTMPNLPGGGELGDVLGDTLGGEGGVHRDFEGGDEFCCPVTISGEMK